MSFGEIVYSDSDLAMNVSYSYSVGVLNIMSLLMVHEEANTAITMKPKNLFIIRNYMPNLRILSPVFDIVLHL